ncbi:hypothetical protein EV197_0240 [Aquimarina brevivitae]|uniref:Uncharacterized protein n=1 Tax=Aquimarina brevivitae TaxID=323412 RepID=A0A4Q7PF14_9FLAO|nr:hypothetical protein EV197_0240 [Aquimarina brevivitae]
MIFMLIAVYAIIKTYNINILSVDYRNKPL